MYIIVKSLCGAPEANTISYAKCTLINNDNNNNKRESLEGAPENLGKI